MAEIGNNFIKIDEEKHTVTLLLRDSKNEPAPRVFAEDDGLAIITMLAASPLVISDSMKFTYIMIVAICSMNNIVELKNSFPNWTDEELRNFVNQIADKGFINLISEDEWLPIASMTNLQTVNDFIHNRLMGGLYNALLGGGFIPPQKPEQPDSAD